jgi:hypothetical protein
MTEEKSGIPILYTVVKLRSYQLVPYRPYMLKLETKGKLMYSFFNINNINPRAPSFGHILTKKRGISRTFGTAAQFCNPSYWEARTWDGLRSAGPRDCGIQ